MFKKIVSKIKGSDFILPVSLLLLQRSFIILRDGVLGYDMGIYKYYFETFNDRLLNNINLLFTKPFDTEPFGLYLLTSPLSLIFKDKHIFIILLSITISVLLLFFVVKITNYFFPGRGVLGGLLFVFSITQLEMFYFFHLKFHLALLLCLMSLYLLQRGKEKLFFAPLAMALFVHPIPFLIFSFAMFIASTLKNKTIKLFYIPLLLLGFVFLLLYPSLFKEISETDIFFNDYRGNFYNLWEYLGLSIPLVFFAVFSLKKKKLPEFNLFYILALIVIIAQFTSLVFSNRFIPILDLSLILMAVAGLISVMEDIESKNVQRAFLLLTFGFLFFSSSVWLFQREPQINKSELTKIKDIEKNTSVSAKIISGEDRLYPWLLGYSDREVIRDDSDKVYKAIKNQQLLPQLDSDYYLYSTNENQVRLYGGRLYRVSEGLYQIK